MIDLQLEIFKYVYKLREEKNKVYSLEDWDKDVIYVFNNYIEFINYFKNSGMPNVKNYVVDRCIEAKLKSGKVIARKWICDWFITMNRPKRNYSFKEIEDIHKRGKLTPWEAVDEWESYGLCVPCNTGRCHVFNTCHDCLKEYASNKYEYESINDFIDFNKSYQRELRKRR